MVAMAPATGTEYIAEDPILPTLESVYRLSKDQYQAMEELGILPPDRRFELLDGIILEKPVPTPQHQLSCRLLIAELAPRLPKGWFLETQSSGDMDESQPEPDGMIYTGDVRTYARSRPEPKEIELIIEVSFSTLRSDRREKGWKYAQNNIPIYWIINLVDEVIEVYTDPQPFLPTAKYATRTVYAKGQDVPVVLDGAAVADIPVAALLP